MTSGPKAIDIRRLAERQGVASMTKDGEQAIVMLIMHELARVTQSACIPATIAHRKTLFTRDVQWAIRKRPEPVTVFDPSS